MASVEEDESSVSEEALRNSIILNQIFMHLPSNFLISTCSLVNKIWYRISRTVLRNHRKCVAQICGYLAYEQIQALDQICTEIERDGRVIPFNGLKIYDCVPLHPEWVQIDLQDLAVYRKIKRLKKLTHLQVKSSQIGLPCALQYTTLSWVLSGQWSQLQSLNIENPFFLSQLFHFCPLPEFPQLETMTIPNLPFSGEGKFVQRMLSTAPNLKRLIVQDANMLNYLPSDKYNLLVKIPFHVKTAEQKQLFRKIAEAKPDLTELLILPPSAAIHYWDRDEDEDSVDPAVRKRSDKMLEQILQTCHASLESIRVIGQFNPIGRLSFPPMTNLTKIKMNKWSSVGSKRFWSDIASIDFNRSIPWLEEIEIVDNDRQFRADGSLDYEEEMREWPTNSSGPLVPPECCSNAHKLSLDLMNKNINLIPIKSMVPNVTMLILKLRHTYDFHVDIAPFADIWKFWSQLVELKIDIGAEYPNRNYDADFCGICEEEAEILREKDETFLRNVHIVAARPSILNVHKLRKLDFELEFRVWNDSTDGAPAFLSHVTQMLAFRRMQHTAIYLAGTRMLQTT